VEGGPGQQPTLFQEGQSQQAIETAKMALQLRPDYPIAHFNLDNFYARQGDSI
jgi:Flp pilus assembly protein TadD